MTEVVEDEVPEVVRWGATMIYYPENSETV